jgi:hypothetical protein
MRRGGGGGGLLGWQAPAALRTRVEWGCVGRGWGGWLAQGSGQAGRQACCRFAAM